MTNDINAEARDWVDNYLVSPEYGIASTMQDMLAAYLAGHASGSASGSVTNVTNVVLPNVTNVEGAGSVFRMTAGETAHSPSVETCRETPWNTPPASDSPVPAPCDTGEDAAASDGQIRWGAEIEVNGEYPTWLTDQYRYHIRYRTEWRGWQDPSGYAGPIDKWSWSVGGKPNILAIRLPVDHFAYAAINAGFEPWGGGDAAPKDWDGSPALCRNGERAQNPMSWSHPWAKLSGVNADGYDIIGYRKRAAQPTRNIGITASDLECETLRREYDAVKAKLDAIVEAMR